MKLQVSIENVNFQLKKAQPGFNGNIIIQGMHNSLKNTYNDNKLVFINRVATVVKGGRRFSFAALVVAGNQKGYVGFGHGKAREVPEAVKKATDSAKNTLIKVWNCVITPYIFLYLIF